MRLEGSAGGCAGDGGRGGNEGCGGAEGGDGGDEGGGDEGGGDCQRWLIVALGLPQSWLSSAEQVELHAELASAARGDGVPAEERQRHSSPATAKAAASAALVWQWSAHRSSESPPSKRREAPSWPAYESTNVLEA